MAATQTRADTISGMVSGYVIGEQRIAQPGSPDDVIDFSGPGQASFTAFGDLANGRIDFASINVGGVEAIYQRGNSTNLRFNYRDSVAGQGSDSLFLSYGTGGTSGSSSASYEFLDPTGNFFESGIFGYGTSIFASAIRSVGIFPATTVTRASLSANRAAPEPSSLLMVGLAGVLVIAGKRLV
ncbi:PEP-CTERM sorting domain-containing protein (plasmid) [Isosphaeraceae bacterium EP7]